MGSRIVADNCSVDSVVVPPPNMDVVLFFNEMGGSR